MATKVDTTKKLRKIQLENANQHPPMKTVTECAFFLQNQLEDYAPTDDPLAWLEKTHLEARNIARAITEEETRVKNDLPDSSISYAESVQIQRENMLELIQHANAMIALINTRTLSWKIKAHLETETLYVTQSNTVGRKIVEQPLTRQLSQFVKELQENLPKEEAIGQTKKSGKSPGRKMAVKAITLAWFSITGKPPEKLKRDKYQQPYGEFHDFLSNALKLFPYKNPSIEGAIKIAFTYWKDREKNKPSEILAVID